MPQRSHETRGTSAENGLLAWLESIACNGVFASLIRGGWRCTSWVSVESRRSGVSPGCPAVGIWKLMTAPTSRFRTALSGFGETGFHAGESWLQAEATVRFGDQVEETGSRRADLAAYSLNGGDLRSGKFPDDGMPSGTPAQQQAVVVDHRPAAGVVSRVFRPSAEDKLRPSSIRCHPDIRSVALLRGHVPEAGNANGPDLRPGHSGSHRSPPHPLWRV